MEYAASVISIVDVAFKLSISVAKFVHEARDANVTRSELFDRVDMLHSTLERVHGVLKKRQSQRRIFPLDDPEKGVWDLAQDILRRCEKTVKRFELQLNCLGGGTSEGWTRRAWLQLKLNSSSPAIAKIEKQIDANVSSAQLMIICFQPFMHEETQTALQDGLQAQNLSADKIYKAVQQIRSDIAKLSRERNIPPIAEVFKPLGLGIVGDNTVSGNLDAEESRDLEDVELMKVDAQFASSLADRISVAGGSVAGTSTPHSYNSTTNGSNCSHIKRKAVPSCASNESQIYCVDEQDITVDSRAGQIKLPVVLELDTDEPPEIVNALIDHCLDEARKAVLAKDYPHAEKSLVEAIGLKESRDKGGSLGSFPFEDRAELRQSLAQIKSKNLKFDEAASEYQALMGEASFDAERFGSLAFELAEMYQVQYAYEGKMEVLKKMEDYAMHAHNTALTLSSREDNPPWPMDYPSLRRTALVLVEVYKITGRTNYADVYTKLYLKPTDTGTSPRPSLGRELPSLLPKTPPQATISPPRSPTWPGPPTIGVPPTPPDTAPDVHRQAMSQPSSTFSDSGCSIGFDRGRPDRGSFAQSDMPNSLHRLIRSGTYDTTILELFLNKYDNIEEKDENGRTPLLLACKDKKIDIVRFLLGREKGPNLMAKDIEGYTCLHLAIFGTDGGIGDEIVNLLIKHGVDVNVATSNSEEKTPLHYAVKHSKLHSARALLDAGADIEALDSTGRSPLKSALRAKKEELCCLLISRGAIYDRKFALRVFDELEESLDKWEKYRSFQSPPHSSPLYKVPTKKKSASTASLKSEVSMMSRFSKFKFPRRRS